MRHAKCHNEQRNRFDSLKKKGFLRKTIFIPAKTILWLTKHILS